MRAVVDPRQWLADVVVAHRAVGVSETLVRDVVRAQAGRERPGSPQPGRFRVRNRRILHRDFARERELAGQLGAIRGADRLREGVGVLLTVREQREPAIVDRGAEPSAAVVAPWEWTVVSVVDAAAAAWAPVPAESDAETPPESSSETACPIAYTPSTSAAAMTTATITSKNERFGSRVSGSSATTGVPPTSRCCAGAYAIGPGAS